jgi:hypothetical protein
VESLEKSLILMLAGNTALTTVEHFWQSCRENHLFFTTPSVQYIIYLPFNKLGSIEIISSISGRMITEYGAGRGMRIGGGNRRTPRKNVLVPFCPPKILHNLAWDRSTSGVKRKSNYISSKCSIYVSLSWFVNTLTMRVKSILNTVCNKFHSWFITKPWNNVITFNMALKTIDSFIRSRF